MVQKLVILTCTALLIFSCGSETTTQDLPQLDVATLSSDVDDYVGKRVSVTGTVVHVCQHGGKRMFIIGEEPDPRFKITAGKIGSFDAALEGSDVVVRGVIQEQKVDGAYLDTWEEGLDAEQKPEAGHEGHDHGTETDDHHENAQNQITALRKRLAESGKESISFYNLECESFDEKEI